MSVGPASKGSGKNLKPAQKPVQVGQPAELAPPVSAVQIKAAVQRLREAAGRFTQPLSTADALASVFAQWRDRTYSHRRDAIAKVAAATRFSPRLLDESLDALIAPFSRDALRSFASRVTPRARVGGFVMPANLPGAGMHELAAALLSGASALVKCSRREPFFFPAFAQSLSEIDPALGARLEVIGFGRERDDLTAAMTGGCDFIVALGTDAGIASLSGGARLFGFGSRAGGALVSLAAPANARAIADALARDVTLFEQQGCLSPHHVFTEDRDGTESRNFATALALALEAAAAKLGPATPSFDAAAAIRRMRESARWRKLGAHPVDLWEGRAMGWTVVFDARARFTVSPGFRTVTVTPVADCADFESRLAPIAGRLEAFALAAPRHERARWLEVLARAGVSYVCDPGQMQSPPILWPHGGGAFIDFICGAQ